MLSTINFSWSIRFYRGFYVNLKKSYFEISLYVFIDEHHSFQQSLFNFRAILFSFQICHGQVHILQILAQFSTLQNPLFVRTIFSFASFISIVQTRVVRFFALASVRLQTNRSYPKWILNESILRGAYNRLWTIVMFFGNLIVVFAKISSVNLFHLRSDDGAMGLFKILSIFLCDVVQFGWSWKFRRTNVNVNRFKSDCA